MPGLNTKMVEFGEWLPDQPALGNAVTVAKNCIPQMGSYRSVNDLQPLSNALNSRALAAFWVRDDSGAFFNFAGTATKLYQLTGTTFGDVSKAGDYSVVSWEFAKWGQRVIACAIDAPTQYFDMGTSTVFADLPGTPPRAKHIAVIGDFIFMGNVYSGSAFYPERIQWGGYNSSELWAPSLSTQSDYQDLFGKGGDVQRIVPGKGVSAVVFQEHAITVWEYRGPPTIFSKTLEFQDRGCAAPNSVCWQGETIYFYSHDGFYAFNGESEPVAIGAEKVDRFIKEDFNKEDPNLMHGAVDRKNRAVFWLYPSRETGANRLICYKLDVQRWSYIDIDAELVFEYSSSAYHLDNIDAVLINGIDVDTFNLDQSPYKGGSVDFVAFGTDHKLSTFTGNPLTAVLETGEFSEFSRRTSIKSARPLTDGTAAMSYASRDIQGDNYSYSLPVGRNRKGECDFRTSGRYHRFRVSVADGFNHAIGAELIFRPEGRN